MSLDPATAALVEELWQRFAPVAKERVAVLERLADAVRAGPVPDALRAEAAAAAHKLAGSLGTYGRGGSDEAAAVEELLGDDGPLDAVPELVERLRRAVSPPASR